MPENTIIIKAEDLAYWFLRINGFFTIQNFIIHPESGFMQRTEVDILGVRFPFRKESVSQDNWMRDFSLFEECNKQFFILAEVKSGICNLNDPWTDESKGNMQRVLRAIGFYKDDILESVANDLYALGVHENDDSKISLLMIGKEKNNSFNVSKPAVSQILFEDILKFIFKRFTDYPAQKSSHQQWGINAKLLWDLAMDSTVEQFVDSVEIIQ